MPNLTGSTIDKVLHIKVDYEEAIKALGRYEATLRDVKNAVNALNRQKRAGAISDSDYNKQMAALGQQTKMTKKIINEYSKELQNNLTQERKADGSLAQLRSRLSNLNKEYDNLSRSARNGVEGIKKLSEIKKVTTEIKEAEAATLRFYRNVGNYQSALQGLKKLSGGFNALGGIITGILGGLSFQSLANNVLDVARAFEDGMARVRAVANPTAAEFEALTEKARELGRTTRYTAQEVAAGMEELARKGFGTQEILNSIKPTLELAQANVVSIADAAQISSSAMRAFGMQVENVAHINDVLSSACANSATNLNMLGQAMKTAGPSAHAANVSLEETVALIGALANVGMTGSDAGTGVKQIAMALVSAAKGTAKQRGVLKKYNIELDETRVRMEGILPILKEMKEKGLGESLGDLKLFSGRYAAPRMAQVINNIDDAIALNDLLKNSYGENARMFEMSLGDTSKAIYTLKSAWDDFLISVYDRDTSKIFVNTINNITDAIRFLSREIDGVITLVQSMVVAFLLKPIYPALLKFRTTLATTMTFAERRVVLATGGISKAAIALSTVFNAQSMLRTRTFTTETVAIQKGAARIQLAFNKMGLAAKEFGLALAKSFAPFLAVTAAVEIFFMIKRAIEDANAVENKIKDIDTELRGIDNLTGEGTESIRTLDNLNKKLKEAHDKVTQLTIARNKAVKGTEDFEYAERALSAAIKEEDSYLKQLNSNLGERWSSYRETLSLSENIELFDKEDKSPGHERKVNELREIQTELDIVHKRVLDTTSAWNNANQNRKDGDDAAKKAADQRSKAELREIELINRVNTLLGTQFKTYNDINSSIDTRIELLKKEAKTRVLMDQYRRAYDQMMKSATELGIAYDPNIGVEGVTDNIARQLNQKLSKAKFAAYMGSLASFASYAGSLAGFDTEFNKLNKGATAAAVMRKLGMRLTKEQRNEALYGKVDSVSNPTKSGDFNDDDLPTSDKELRAAANKLESARTFLENSIKKYKKILNDYEEYNITDLFKKERLKIENAYKEQILDIQTFISVNKKRMDLLKNSEYAKDVEKLTQLLTDIEVEALKKQRTAMAERIREEMRIRNKLQLEIISGSMEGLDEGLMSDLRKRLYMQSLSDSTQKKTDELSLKSKYLKGEFYTGEDVSEERLAEYYKKRKQLKEKYGEDSELTSEQRDDMLKETQQLNEKYQAESQYYAMMENLQIKYNAAYIRRQQEFTDKQNSILIQGLENRLAELKITFEEEDNLRYGHYKRLEFGTTDYWAQLTKRIGAEQAKQLQIEYDNAQKELELVESRGRNMGETEEEYNAKRIAAKEKLVNVETSANDAIEKSDEARWQAAQALTGGLITLTEQLGEDSKSEAKLAKVLALAQIAISTGEAIAKMTAKESGKGIIGLGTMAAGIAAILSNIAQAIATVKSAKFATGAVNIRGAGTSTSDSIPAYISSGESVINAKATKMFEPLLIAMNNIGNNVPLPRRGLLSTSSPEQMDELRNAIVQAVANVRPVVDVREVTRAQNRIEVIQRLDTV